jgi:hypothetical protein
MITTTAKRVGIYSTVLTLRSYTATLPVRIILIILKRNDGKGILYR